MQIDRKELESFVKVFNHEYRCKDWSESNFFTALDNWLKPKAENLPISDVTQWVAVDEKLPEDSEWILLANVDDQWVDRGEMTVTGKWYNGECEIIPTHWMPLPKPPCG
jgi:hypothetical protein